MKLRKSLAQQDWVASPRYNGNKQSLYQWEVREKPFVPNGHTVEISPLQAGCLNKETAVAIAALPKLYALALEIMKTDAREQFSHRSTAWPRIVEAARAALDAANCADEGLSVAGYRNE